MKYNDKWSLFIVNQRPPEIDFSKKPTPLRRVKRKEKFWESMTVSSLGGSLIGMYGGIIVTLWQHDWRYLLGLPIGLGLYGLNQLSLRRAKETKIALSLMKLRIKNW